MPAVSQKQRGLIFGKRNQYGSESNTPKNWKWIWKEGWENQGKLPKYKKRKEKKINESRIMRFDEFVEKRFKADNTGVILNYEWDDSIGKAEKAAKLAGLKYRKLADEWFKLVKKMDQDIVPKEKVNAKLKQAEKVGEVASKLGKKEIKMKELNATSTIVTDVENLN
jgi:L-fucose isomerase-like protein